MAGLSNGVREDFMPYKLKDSENEFQVTREGEFEYKIFQHGKLYDRVPPEEADRFEIIENKREQTEGSRQ